MDSKKSYIPLKVFVSYLALAALVAIAGWILYSQNNVFSATENKIAVENNRVLKVSNLLSNMYKAESLARVTIQSDSGQDFKDYLIQAHSLQSEIDSLKLLGANKQQIILLDSVKYLLSIKTANIRKLKAIKNKANDEVAVKNAIDNITRMEGSLRKLRLDDFVKDPEILGEYEKSVLVRYVDYMNQNIPNDSTNTLSQKALDSVLIASKALLSEVKRETAKRKQSLNSEENKLLQNELSISSQLRKILSEIEREIIINTTKSNAKKEVALKKTNEIVSVAAIIGFLLTVFFSILILNDFSKTQSYKKQLEAAKITAEKLLKNREQLISTVSHDIKTPLSTIMGYTELLGNSELNNKQSHYTDTIKGSSEYISNLVQDLLDFTQIEAGKITIETIPFSLTAIITEVARSIQSVYSTKAIELIIEIEDTLIRKVMGDPFRLRQILTNIIGNAYKFTEAGTIQVKAKTDTANNAIIITVADSGIGIREENQAVIFEEFTQADKNIEKKYGGTGLGLTISRKMAEILGGSLTLSSTYGKGSTFQIQLPLVYEPAVFQRSNSMKGGIEIPPADMPITVLIIDDDSSLQKLTAEVLRQNNYDTISFDSASAALEAIRITDFDIIISDIQMPGMDGFAFIEALRNTTGTKYNNQPIIALTGRTDLSTDVYKKAGFETLVRKPYSPFVLVKTIAAIINQTDIPENIAPEDLFDPDRAYSLSSLKMFIPNDKNALNEVLLSFVTATKESMAIVETALVQKDYTLVKETAHKMHTMFRQLQATEISLILKRLELDELSDKEMTVVLENLKEKITVLMAQIEKDLVV